MFTNAGMNQFKSIFLEQEQPAHVRVANSQKCMRVSGKHNDLEEVGLDTSHHTFFEMLGNWSFGDYYKAEAIEWAWNLLIKEWALPPDRLYATVYKDDDEAEGLWKKITSLPSDHILRFDEKDNFWEMGEVGPCGPCSEIHFDLGAELDQPGIPSGVNVDGCRRFIEIWNLVFIQYDRQADRSLQPLPKKHIDTGMGFERIVSILQNKQSNYDTDIFQDIIHFIEEQTNKSYKDVQNQVPMRVIADHLRAAAFCIADGALPSNEGRGYVIRRILRRAIRYATKLERYEPLLHSMVKPLCNQMGGHYPELLEHQTLVERTIQQEEENFGKTLGQGSERFEELIGTLKKKGIQVFPGEEAFKLYDTFGFPLDLTTLMAREQGFQVDMEAFERLMNEQRNRARSASSFKTNVSTIDWTVVAEDIPSQFVGYDCLTCETKLVKYSIDENSTHLVTKETPFYGESGGQIGDVGTITIQNQVFEVVDTQLAHGSIIHRCANRIPPEILETGEKIVLAVDPIKRSATARNHTATHLLHTALKKKLGDHVTQQGSLVDPKRLRFDFNHFEKVTSEELYAIETLVNRTILENRSVKWYDRPFSEVKQEGVIALFGEKYGDVVRVVEVDGYSKELCGGTHVNSAGALGYFKILAESSSASGIRRIEAITGMEAYDWINEQEQVVLDLQQILHVTQPFEVTKKIQTLLEEQKELQKVVQQASFANAKASLDELLAQAQTVDGFKVAYGTVAATSTDELRSLGDEARDKLKSGVAVFYSPIGEKHQIICVVTDDLIKQRKLFAGKIVKDVAQLCEGGGGGKPHLALAGIKAPDKWSGAQQEIPHIIQAHLNA